MFGVRAHLVLDEIVLKNRPTGCDISRLLPGTPQNFLFLLLFFIINFVTCQLNSKGVSTLSDLLDKSRGRRCLPFSPPVRAFIFYRE